MYPDFRRMTEPAIKQEVRTMSEQTLNRAMRGRGGPKINPHQESLLQDELDQRRQDREYATQMAIEANKRVSDFGSINTNEAIATLQDPGFEPIERNLEQSATTFRNDYGSDTSSVDINEAIIEPDYTPSLDSSIGENGPSVPDSPISEEEMEALLLLGAILYEAVLIKRTEDTIQAQINHSDEFFITDPTLPEQITELLWTTHDTESRIPYLESILGDDSAEAINAIESLAENVA